MEKVDKAAREEGNQVLLQPIGTVHSPFPTRAGTPKQGVESNERARIEIFPRFREGLQGLEECSRVVLITWLNLGDRRMLKVHPRGDTTKPKQGVFSTRSPDRPNPIGLTVVKIVSLSEEGFIAEGIDILDGTPVLDVKPFVERIDSPEQSEKTHTVSRG